MEFLGYHHGVEGFRFDGLGIEYLLFADDVVLLASPVRDPLAGFTSRVGNDQKNNI